MLRSRDDAVLRSGLAQVEEAIAGIVAVVRGLEDPEAVRMGEWSAKDVLGHIAFWHESFARNARALAEGRPPKVLAGAYPDLNRAGVHASRPQSVGQIVRRIRTAQAAVRRAVAELPDDTPIPYRKGSRDYTPGEHLEIVRAHIVAHHRKIERARRRRARRAGTGAPSAGRG